jgi:hypothetical protein
MRPMGVDDCPRITLWSVSCTGVKSDRLRPISMKVFLMMRFSEAPLSTRVLATLCHPIGSLTTKGKFQLDSFVSGWSSGPNDMSMSAHFILLSGLMRWARLISHSSFFPCVFEAMDILPSKITLISYIWSLLSRSAWWCSPRWGSCVARGGRDIFLRFRKVLHSFRSRPSVRWISHHFSTSAGRRNKLFSFWFVGCCWRFLRYPYDLCDPCDLCDQLCWPPDRHASSLRAPCHVIQGVRLGTQRPRCTHKRLWANPLLFWAFSLRSPQ